MNTKKISDDNPNKETQPVSPFGTAPELGARLKHTSYTGMSLKGRYLIEGELGRGGIGVVYLARDTQLLQRRVVIKVLLEDWENSAHTPWFKKKFEQEIEALVRLDHPCIVGALDAGVMPDGKPFFVMQFVEGATLRSFMTDELMALPRVAAIMRQIGAALSAAHEKGIVHRDLKPENVMIQTMSDGEELVKLIDFGIASVKDSQFATTAERTRVAGALPYMAPEQLRGMPEISCDIWAMGVIAFELITGRLPFIADTAVRLHELQRKGVDAMPSRLRDDLPAAAESAILRALAYEPLDRYARAKDFGDELARALTEAKTHPVGLQPGEQAMRPPSEKGVDGDPQSHESGQAGASRSPAPPTTISPPGELAPEKANAPAPPAIPGKAVALIAIVVVALTAAIWFMFLRNPAGQQTGGGQGKQTPQPPIAQSRSLNYSLKVRLNPAKNPDKPPVELPGEVIFSPGDELCIVFNSPQDGYLYIINEGPNLVNGLPQYNFLFPDPNSVPAHSPSLRANQQLFVPSERPPWFLVDSEQGTEKQWLVWAERPVAELEPLKKWLNERDYGEIKDANEIRSVHQFLNQKYSTARPTYEKDEHQTRLKSDKDGLLVYPINLKHY